MKIKIYLTVDQNISNNMPVQIKDKKRSNSKNKNLKMLTIKNIKI